MLSGMLPSKMCGFNKKIPEEPGSKNPPKAPPTCLRRSCLPSAKTMDGWQGSFTKKTTQTSCKNYYEVTPNPNFMQKLLCTITNPQFVHYYEVLPTQTIALP